jgi:sugar phosphate isomerase/epimerase
MTKQKTCVFPRANLEVPSWVIPGTYLENLRFLEDKHEVRGVELLFFLYNDEIRDQLKAEWEGIRQFVDRFIFTAHLPDPLLPEHEELVHRLNPLVRTFIVHPGPPENAPAFGSMVNSWAKKYSASLCRTDLPVRFLAENTNPGMLEALLPHLDGDVGLCMDTGHLLLDGKSPAEYFTKHRNRIGEIHLHGLDREKAAIDGRLVDHRPVRAEERWFGELFPLLKDFTGIINMEVFSWEEAAAGINSIKQFVRCMDQ